MIRVGAFPNITHAQAMVGKANGSFEKAMGSGVKIEWTSFNAGPSAIEALFCRRDRHDLRRPQSHDQRLCALEWRSAAGDRRWRPVVGPPWWCATIRASTSRKTFTARKLASPQLGNTQDVALRAWLKAHGMKPTDKGGDVQVIPLANPDQLTLFLQEATGCGVGAGALGHAPDS